MIKDFEHLKDSVGTSEPRTVAVAAAHDPHTLEAVLKAKREGILDYILVGKSREIMKIGRQMGYEISKEFIVDAESDEDAAAKSIELIHDKSADFLQKGLLQTSTLLKAVVNKKTGISKGRPMSHVALLDIPCYHKITGVTDGGMMINPDLEGKKAIVRNAVEMFHGLGYEKPFVSVEGPISFDLSVSKESAGIKKYESPVTGETDIFFVPNITVGNVMVKALTAFAKARMAGCVVGAQCPIALNSRSASFEEKYFSLLACAQMVQK